jgi:biopolymer transport protein ExbD/biopolymer transport protein TolR
MMSRSTEGDNDTPLAEINVTPFVDVMLVLFVIFLVIAPLITKTLPIDLPKASAPASEIKDHAVEIQLDLSGNILLDGRPVTGERLEQIVHELAAHDPRIGVSLHADRRVPFDRVARVLSSVSRAGVSHLSIVTEDEHAENR